MKASKKHFWNALWFWLSAIIVVIVTIIGYGIWLSFSAWDKLAP